MSKNIFLCTVASVAVATSSAFAADVAVKAAPAPRPAPWNWSGFYIGAHGGYGWKRNDFADVVALSPLLTIGDIDSNGWVAGGQAGYHWQYGRWVAGVEVDGSATRIRGDSTPLVRTFAGGISITDIESDDVKYLGTARARLGGVPFTSWDVLLYGTAGLAWERVNRIDSQLVVTPTATQLSVNTSPRDHFGWVAGAGAEFRIGATNWIGRVEYLHYDFGTVESTTAVSTTGTGSFADSGGRQTINVVRGGLSYKFGPDWSSSPLAAYAADMSVKAAPASAPAPWSWSGFYIGAHGGYGWKRNDFAEVVSTAPLLTVGGIDSSGWVLGGQAGYNWQYGRWVAGLEVDGSATRIRGDSTPLIRDLGGGVTQTEIESDDVKYLGTVRARLGGVPFTSWNVLLYGTAGLAWERVNRIETTNLVAPGITQLVTNTSPRDHFGWVAGVGAEFRLGASNWIGRVEYLHYDFGTVESTTVVSTTGAAGNFADSGGRQTINIVRGGLSYKFGPDWSSSPLAAYAADMSVKAAPASAPAPWSWAGFYIGAHGGYGWKRNDFAEVIQLNPTITLGGIDSSGWVLGGQAGYNWQYGRWVAGLEVDGSATRIRGDSTPVVRDLGGGVTITDIESDDVKYLGTARARLGGAPFTRWDVLLYGTAGLAWERVNRTETNLLVAPGVSQLVNSTSPRDHFGWVAGAGGEIRIGATNWIGRIEYLHYDFATVEQTTTVSVTPGAGSFADSAGRQTINVVRGGLSYKF